MTDNRAKMLRRVQAAHFAAHEAMLFLDTHPHDEEALAYFKRWRDTAAEAAAAYEARFGPLKASSAESCWDWVNNPWPWEYEANA